MSDEPTGRFPPDDDHVLRHLSIPLTVSELAEQLGVDRGVAKSHLDRLLECQLVKSLVLSKNERIYVWHRVPASTLTNMIRARLDGLPPIIGNGNRVLWLSADEVRVAACIGRSQGYISISELSRETDVLRDGLRRMLFDLVWQGVLSETPLSSGRRQYRLTGVPLEKLEALEETPHLPAKPSDSAFRKGSGPRHRNEPTGNEEKVIEFLSRPATQEEIAERFGYGRSRRSEVIRSLISKGLARKCGNIGREEFYVRTEVSDEDANLFLASLPGSHAADEAKVLEHLGAPASVQEIAERIGRSATTVVDILRILMSRGQVVCMGRARDTRYVRSDAQDESTIEALRWADGQLTRLERDVVSFLEESGHPVPLVEISEKLGTSYFNLASRMKRLVTLGVVNKLRIGPHRYAYALASLHVPPR